METFVQLLVVGLTSGAIYGLIALGFTLIYTSSSVLNFAQGEFVMLGAVSAAIMIAAGVSYLLAFLAACALGALAGLLVYGAAVKPLVGRGTAQITVVMATLAVAIMVAAGSRYLVGTKARYVPPILSGEPVNFFGVVVARQNLMIVAITGSLVVLIWRVLYRSDWGLDVRAVGVDRRAAELVGVNVARVMLSGFAVSGAIGAIGGVLLAPIIGATPNMGLGLTVTGFIAAVVGGIANPFSALAGGLFVGLLEVMVSGYLSTSLTEVSVFLLLPIVLLLRPHGLFVRTAK